MMVLLGPGLSFFVLVALCASLAIILGRTGYSGVWRLLPVVPLLFFFGGASVARITLGGDFSQDSIIVLSVLFFILAQAVVSLFKRFHFMLKRNAPPRAKARARFALGGVSGKSGNAVVAVKRWPTTPTAEVEVFR